MDGYVGECVCVFLHTFFLHKHRTRSRVWREKVSMGRIYNLCRASATGTALEGDALNKGYSCEEIRGCTRNKVVCRTPAGIKIRFDFNKREHAEVTLHWLQVGPPLNIVTMITYVKVYVPSLE